MIDEVIKSIINIKKPFLLVTMIKVKFDMKIDSIGNVVYACYLTNHRRLHKSLF